MRKSSYGKVLEDERAKREREQDHQGTRHVRQGAIMGEGSLPQMPCVIHVLTDPL